MPVVKAVKTGMIVLKLCPTEFIDAKILQPSILVIQVC